MFILSLSISKVVEPMVDGFGSFLEVNSKMHLHDTLGFIQVLTFLNLFKIIIVTRIFQFFSFLKFVISICLQAKKELLIDMILNLLI